ncbi:MAG: hypothetical protein FJ295_18280 [Planctomycetes bacterium]|nr:hypothetical protein [Planctomycetota bacterium]
MTHVENGWEANRQAEVGVERSCASNGWVATACPACGGSLREIRAKFVCERCHTICESCCEGGR